MGLTASLIVDMLITASLFHYLGLGRTISTACVIPFSLLNTVFINSSLDAVIDSVLMYTLESGALTW
jgi:hypothetical protein